MTRSTTLSAASVSLLAAILLFPASHGWSLAEPSRPAASNDRERSLRDAAGRDPRDGRAREMLGSYYLEKGRPYSALWEIQEAVTLQPQDFLSRINLGNALAAAGWPGEARAVFAEMLRRQPGRLEVCRRLADLALQTAQPEEAIRSLEQSSSLRRSPEALIVLGQAYQALGKPEEARAAFEESRKLLLENPEAFFRLGRLLFASGRLDAARQAFMAVTFWNPRRPDGHLWLGLVALKQNRRAEARAAFEGALRADPAYGPAKLQLGLLEAKEGRIQEAHRQLAEAATHGATSAEAHLALARLAEARGDRPAAYRHRGAHYHARGLHAREAAVYRAWAAALPRDIDAALALCRAESEMNHTAAARRIADNALKRHPREPRNAEFRFTLGEAHSNQSLGDNRERDEPKLARAVARAPTNARYRALWAEALRQIGRTEEARLQLLRSLDLDPLQVSLRKDPLKDLTQISRDARRADQAALWERLARAAEAHRRQEARLRQQTWDRPGDPTAYVDLARHLIERGDLHAAESQLAEALRLRPGQPEAITLKGRVDRALAVE